MLIHVSKRVHSNSNTLSYKAYRETSDLHNARATMFNPRNKCYCARLLSVHDIYRKELGTRIHCDFYYPHECCIPCRDVDR